MTLRYDNLGSITLGITIEQKMLVGIVLLIIATRCYLGKRVENNPEPRVVLDG